MRRAAYYAAWAAICVTLWLTLASLAFLWLGGGLLVYPPLQRPYQWARYAPYFGRNFWESCYLVAGAALASMPFVAFARLNLRLAKLRPARPWDSPEQPVRSRSTLHDSADWLTTHEARSIFPGPRGVVIGEAYRVDQDSVAGVRFDPEKPATWGQGGKASLLIDPHTRNGGHGLVFAGMGAGKTKGIVAPSLDPIYGWPGSAVVLDPSCQ